MAAPRGLGGPGPHAEVHRHVEGVTPGPGNGARGSFLEQGEEGRQDSRHPAMSPRRALRGSGDGDPAGDPGPSWWALGLTGGGKQPPPGPAAFLP